MTPTVLSFLEWGGCASGVLGSLLLALNNRFSGFGFVLFIVSNLCWASFAILTGTGGLLLQQCFFTATSVLGIWKWLVKPAQSGAQMSQTDHL